MPIMGMGWNGSGWEGVIPIVLTGCSLSDDENVRRESISSSSVGIFMCMCPNWAVPDGERVHRHCSVDVIRLFVLTHTSYGARLSEQMSRHESGWSLDMSNLSTRARNPSW